MSADIRELVIAAENSDHIRVRRLLDQKTNPNLIYEGGYGTSLMAHAMHGAWRGEDAISTAVALINAGAKPDQPSKCGYTPLMIAVNMNKIPAVKLLLSNKANINAVEDRGFTPFILAAQKGDRDMIRFLVCAKADPHVVDNEGNTVVDHARKYSRNPGTEAFVLSMRCPIPAAPPAPLLPPML